MSSSRTFIATTPDEIDALEPLWDELLDNQEHSLFQRFSWNRLAAEMFSDRLTPFVVSAENDTGAAIIPAAVNHSAGRLELLGEVLFDYRDVLQRGDTEALRLAWQKLSEQGKPLHVLSLNCRVPESRWENFPLAPFARAPQVHRAVIDEEAFRAAHSRLGRQMRRLHKQGVALRVSTGADADVLRRLYACKRNHFAVDESDNVFVDERRCEFMIAAAGLEPELCDVYTLEQGDSVVAGLVTFRDGGMRRFYTIYFNPLWARYSPGQALLYEVTARSLADGLNCDYMTGEYQYKLRLANASCPLFRVNATATQLEQIARGIPAFRAA